MLQRQLLGVSILVLSGAAAHAQSFAFNVSPNSASLIDASLEQALPGAVIGNHDPVNNPTGTLTLPGLFGGSGNQPVAMDITFHPMLAFKGTPTGSFQADVDLVNGQLTVSNFFVDALGGANAPADLTLDLLYATFRTFQPSSVFIGGIPLSLPLGQATVSGVFFEQIGESVGSLVPIPALPGTYTVTLLVPASVTFTVDVLGQVTQVGPLPIGFGMNGTLTTGGGTAQLVINSQQAVLQTIPDPLPGQTIDDFPMPVPTILPPGATANLLFNAVFGELTVDFASTFDLIADGTAVCAVERFCVPTPNSVGTGAVLDVIGSPSVSANAMILRTSNLPDHRVTVVRFGNQVMQAPFGAGVLCVGGTSYRLPVVYSTPAGIADSPVDFSIPSPKYQALVPGSTWYFQCLYRDPLFSNPAGNASDAIRVQICP